MEVDSEGDVPATLMHVGEISSCTYYVCTVTVSVYQVNHLSVRTTLKGLNVHTFVDMTSGISLTPGAAHHNVTSQKSSSRPHGSGCRVPVCQVDQSVVCAL
jgi:hypothetical protein